MLNTTNTCEEDLELIDRAMFSIDCDLAELEKKVEHLQATEKVSLMRYMARLSQLCAGICEGQILI